MAIIGLIEQRGITWFGNVFYVNNEIPSRKVLFEWKPSGREKRMHSRRPRTKEIERS